MRGAKGMGKLLEAAEREWEFGVEVERGGGEAAEGEGELGGEEELKGELGFATAALRHQLRDGVAGDAAAEEPVQHRTAHAALLGCQGFFLLFQ
ncbi:unnamed protein product [Camellia sinensis]